MWYIINYNFCKIFLLKIDEFFDECIFIGDGLIVFEIMCLLVYSIFVDLIYYVCDFLSLVQICKIVEVYI